MTALSTIDQHGAPQLYQRMQTAISECYNVDEIKKIGDQAAAIAAYYKQIKDDESVRKFLQIKLRAWRRIGLILMQVDDTDCVTQTAYCQKIKQHVKDDVVQQMGLWTIANAVKLARVPEDFFEDNVANYRSTDALLSAYHEAQRQEWLRTPEGRATAAAQQKRNAEHEQKRQAERDKWTTAEEAKRAEEEAAYKDYDDYVELRHEAFGEVGMTMDRRDREEMKQVVFLIKKPVHEKLRKAAFDQRTTMQAVLRAGLKMWFLAHGVDVDV